LSSVESFRSCGRLRKRPRPRCRAPRRSGPPRIAEARAAGALGPASRQISAAFDDAARIAASAKHASSFELSVSDQIVVRSELSEKRRTFSSLSVGSAAAGRRAARIWPESDPARSACGAGAPRPRCLVHATWRASSHPPRGSHADVGDVPGRDASRRGYKPKMLQVLARASPGELVVGREHSAQRIEHVLSCLPPRATLAEGSRNLQHTRDDPTLLVGLVEGDREVDRGRHGHSVEDSPRRPRHPPRSARGDRPSREGRVFRRVDSAAAEMVLLGYSPAHSGTRLIVSASYASESSGLTAQASSSGVLRIASISLVEPPTSVELKSISLATHHARSAGQKMFGDCGQKIPWLKEPTRSAPRSGPASTT
jgi:hypothetical protein